MTQPLEGAGDLSRIHPDDIKTLVNAFTENAHRLGLKWLVRPGTIVTGIDTANMSVKVDGDEVATTGVVSMIGSLIAGQRVFLLIIPTIGTYIVGRVGKQMPNLVERFYAIATGDLVLGAAATLIPGLTHTVEIGDFEYDVTGVFDFDETSVGTTVGVGELFIDGVVASISIATFEMTAVTHRATVTQQWSGEVHGGSQHVMELRGRRSAASGSQSLRTGHTSMRIWIYR